MELVAPPAVWSPRHHGAGTKSAAGQCTWGAPCGAEAVWSVHVADRGGESRRAACEEHRAASPVLSALPPATGPAG
ncbi:hypothetical protein [Streptomyces sp. NPDC060194]|uniref:hypothetical protein n=1 Tax=Streptomyces sp. NPDC060194 TaxID=3347069 RepID=UPI0036552A1F